MLYHGKKGCSLLKKIPFFFFLLQHPRETAKLWRVTLGLCSFSAALLHKAGVALLQLLGNRPFFPFITHPCSGLAALWESHFLKLFFHSWGGLNRGGKERGQAAQEKQITFPQLQPDNKDSRKSLFFFIRAALSQEEDRKSCGLADAARFHSVLPQLLHISCLHRAVWAEKMKWELPEEIRMYGRKRMDQEA